MSKNPKKIAIRAETAMTNKVNLKAVFFFGQFTYLSSSRDDFK